ncbi:unnamed protein product [Auanema sp. JU1783]|nr:unnamed protein product [Auanema sp. JU1783]
MSTFNHSSSYNRTYEKKIIQEAPRIRIPEQLTSRLDNFPEGLLHGLTFPSTQNYATSESVRLADDSFHATLDVRDYSPEDLKVSVIGDQIQIEGSFTDKKDDLGLISKSFSRKFKLPKDVKPDAVTSNLTSDGFLTVVALPPKREASPLRSIPIKVITSPPATPAATAAPATTENK